MQRINHGDRSTWPPEGEDVLVWSDGRQGWFVWYLSTDPVGGAPRWGEYYLELGYEAFHVGNWWHPLPAEPEGAA